MVNVENAVKLRDHLILHPEEHNQTVWGEVKFDSELDREPLVGLHDIPRIHCRTGACAAGWTTLQAGDKFIIDPKVWESKTVMVEQVITPEGRRRKIRTRAQELLGIGDRTADELFHAYNSTTAIVVALTMLINGWRAEKVCKYLYDEREKYDD